MFQRYDPREGKRLGFLDPHGNLVLNDDEVPIPGDEELIEAYRLMILARQADDWAVNLNRQGRMPTYPPSRGQEASSVGAVLALKREDWLVPSFRELGGLLARRIPLAQFYLYWYGNENGSHLPIEQYRTLPLCVPVGTQTLHAVGLGYAEKLKESENAVLCFLGDGAVAVGDTHEAWNLAAVWGVGVVFFVQNNQWAISVPVSRQTGSKTLAEKAFAYGFEGVQVDGNDLFAVYGSVKKSLQKARAGLGPTLIESYTYRMGAHTTSDDPSRYRNSEEVAEWEAKDPILRLERYLYRRNLLTEGAKKQIKNECFEEVKEAFETTEAYPEPTLEETFCHSYASMPEILTQQMARRGKLCRS
jgi:pyruvate dehydrogenase E1 component alpha subunit